MVLFEEKTFLRTRLSKELFTFTWWSGGRFESVTDISTSNVPEFEKSLPCRSEVFNMDENKGYLANNYENFSGRRKMMSNHFNNVALQVYEAV